MSKQIQDNSVYSELKEQAASRTAEYSDAKILMNDAVKALNEHIAQQSIIKPIAADYDAGLVAERREGIKFVDLPLVRVPAPGVMLNKLVCIKWVDSCSGGHWEMIADFKHELCYCTTYGKVIADDDDCYSVASTFADDQYLAPLTIPKCAVKSINLID